MNIGLVYPYIIKSSLKPGEENVYDDGARRFLDTYHKFHPEVYHSFHWVKCNESTENLPRINHPEGSYQHSYDGVGFDVGAWMKVARYTSHDFMIFCNSLVYFTQPGWMEKLIDARVRYGPGLYGYFASFERTPHIRTTIWACDPKTLLAYPEHVASRGDTLDFESGPKRFGRFIEKRKEPVLWVAADGVYDQQEWAGVSNGFRSGDQSNLLVGDRHVAIYAAASDEVRLELHNRAWPVS